MLGIEPRTSCKLGGWFTSEPQPYTLTLLFNSFTIHTDDFFRIQYHQPPGLRSWICGRIYVCQLWPTTVERARFIVFQQSLTVRVAGDWLVQLPLARCVIVTLQNDCRLFSSSDLRLMLVPSKSRRVNTKNGHYCKHRFQFEKKVSDVAKYALCMILSPVQGYWFRKELN